MKIDPHNNKKRYLNWKKKGYPLDVSESNARIIIEYLSDMENGLNCTRRGIPTYCRLNNLRQRMGFMARVLERVYEGKKLIDLTDKEIVSFFKKMRDGEILTQTGQPYTSIPDYANVFKAFWHWYQRVEANKDRHVRDITRYIDVTPVKDPGFVYFTEGEFKKLMAHASFKYKALMFFLFDSGIRSPTELVNIRVFDLTEAPKGRHLQLDIREKVSKTFGRKINLLLSSNILREYIEDQQLSREDFLFPINHIVVNQYLKRLAFRVLGNEKTLGGEYAGRMTLYDFRHSSACYWVMRYKSESALKYRFGWKKIENVHYYTKLLGMRDSITEEDLFTDSEAKTQVEEDLEKETKTRGLIQEQLDAKNGEIEELREEIASCKQHDQIILRLLQQLLQQDKGKDIFQALHSEGLVAKLMPSGMNGGEAPTSPPGEIMPSLALKSGASRSPVLRESV